MTLIHRCSTVELMGADAKTDGVPRDAKAIAVAVLSERTRVKSGEALSRPTASADETLHYEP